MKAKILVYALPALILATVHVAGAQQPGKVSWIGYLTGSGSSPNQAFVQGLRELGYVEGKNIIIEYRYTEGKEGPLPELAAELVRLKVDITVTAGSSLTRAAKEAMNTI